MINYHPTISHTYHTHPRNTAERTACRQLRQSAAVRAAHDVARTLYSEPVVTWTHPTVILVAPTVYMVQIAGHAGVDGDRQETFTVVVGGQDNSALSIVVYHVDEYGEAVKYDPRPAVVGDRGEFL